MLSLSDALIFSNWICFVVDLHSCHIQKLICQPNAQSGSRLKECGMLELDKVGVFDLITEETIS